MKKVMLLNLMMVCFLSGAVFAELDAPLFKSSEDFDYKYEGEALTQSGTTVTFDEIDWYGSITNDGYTWTSDGDILSIVADPELSKTGRFQIRYHPTWDSQATKANGWTMEWRMMIPEEETDPWIMELGASDADKDDIFYVWPGTGWYTRAAGTIRAFDPNDGVYHVYRVSQPADSNDFYSYVDGEFIAKTEFSLARSLQWFFDIGSGAGPTHNIDYIRWTTGGWDARPVMAQVDEPLELAEEGQTSGNYLIGPLAGSNEDIIVTVHGDPNLILNGGNPGDDLILTFVATNDPAVPAAEQTVTVQAFDDELLEDTHVASIEHSVSSNDPLFDGTDSIGVVEVTIEDNDFFCGQEGTVYLAADIGGPEGCGDEYRDCYVTIHDFACTAQTWLDCTDPADPVSCPVAVEEE